VNAGADYISKLSRLSKPCHQAPSPNPFSNDGECPEELHVLNWSQVRSLPASAVAQSVEQLKRFSTPLSPSPLSNHPQSWRMPERTTSGNQRVQISPRSNAAKSLHLLSPLFFKSQSPQMVTNADGTTCLRSLRSGVRIPPVPPNQVSLDTVRVASPLTQAMRYGRRHASLCRPSENPNGSHRIRLGPPTREHRKVQDIGGGLQAKTAGTCNPSVWLNDTMPLVSTRVAFRGFTGIASWARSISNSQ